MPLSTFDGEPTETLHEHYNAKGKLTGFTVVITPGWSEDNRAWALGLAEREAQQCSRGHDLSDALDERWLWTANPPAVCLACVAVDESMKAHEKDPRHRAMLHSVQKAPRAEAHKGAAKPGASPHQKPRKPDKREG